MLQSEKRNATLQEQLTLVKAKGMENQQVLAEYLKGIEDAKRERDQQLKANQLLEADLTAFRSQVTTLEQRLTASANETSSLRHAGSESQRAIHERDRRIEELEGQLHSRVLESANLHESTRMAVAARETADRNTESLKAEIARLQSLLQAAETTHATITVQLEAQLSAALEELRHVETEAKAARAEADGNRGKLQSLSMQLNEALSRENEMTQQISSTLR